MNFVKAFDLFGTTAQQIPCITGKGAPTNTTEGAVGCLYMDTDTDTIYKCTAIDNGEHVWKSVIPVDSVKNIATGQMLALTDAVNAPISGLKIFGSAKQTTIFGYQMFNESIVDYSSMIFNDDGTVTAMGNGDNAIVISSEALNSLEEGEYYITIESVDGYEFSEDECGMGYVYRDADGELSEVSSETISAGVKHKSKIEIKGTDRAENYINPGNIPCGTTLKVMLSKQADADWEPYTGGEILPKPVIEKVVGTGATGSITGHFIGSNLCPDAPLIKEVTYYDNSGLSYEAFGYVIDIPAGEYTISFKGWENVQDGDILSIVLANNSLIVNYEDPAYAYNSIETCLIDGSPGAMRTGATFIKVPKNSKLIVRLGYTLEDAKDLSERIKLQVRPTIPADLEDTANPIFIPYTGKDVTFPISKELLALPELGAYDYIDTKRGIRVEKVAKLVLTGEESGARYDADTNTVCYDIYEAFGSNLFFYSIYSDNKVSVLCDDYKGVSYNDGINREGLPLIYITRSYIYICDPKYSTHEDWKAHLKQRYAEGNPVTIYLALKAGTKTPLTEEEKQAVQNAQTYYPSTTIYTDDGTELEVEYQADTKSYIDNKIAELTAALITE